MVFCSVDVLTQDSWRLLNELDDPELKDLASRLPATILRSRADSTVKKYLSAYRRWRTWATDHKLDDLFLITFSVHVIMMFMVRDDSFISQLFAS